MCVVGNCHRTVEYLKTDSYYLQLTLSLSKTIVFWEIQNVETTLNFGGESVALMLAIGIELLPLSFILMM